MGWVESLLWRRVRGVPVIQILLVAASLALAGLAGAQSTLATALLVAVGGIAVLLLLIRNPLIGVGMVVTLAVTGGLTQIFRDSILQRLYVIMLGMTLLAYMHHLYADRKLLKEWLTIRFSDVIFVAFLLVGMLSILVAEYQGPAYSTLGELGRCFVLYFLVTRSIRTFDDLAFVSKFLLVGGIWQASTAWGDSAFAVVDSNAVERVSGNLESVNSFASALLMALPWAFFNLRHGSLLWKAVGLAGVLVLPYTMLGAVSRGSVVVLVILAVFWPLASARSLSNKLKMIIPALLICIYGLTMRWDALMARWPSLEEFLSNDNVTYVVDDDGGRDDLRAVAQRIFAEHWVLGVGIGNTPYYIGFERKTYRPFHVHSMYYEIAADMGVLGLSAFVGLIGFAGLQGLLALRHAASDRERALIASGVSLIIILAVVGSVGNRHYTTSTYFLIACGFVVAHVAQRQRVIAPALARSSRATPGPQLPRPLKGAVR